MAQQSENQGSKDKIALSLQTDRSVLRKEEPYFLTLTIKNPSAEEFKLEGSLTLRLEMVGQTEEQKKKLGPNFWSWVSLPPELLQDTEIKQRGSLLQGEHITIQLDMSQLKWGQSILSGYPSRSTFTLIPEGQYDLFVESEAKDGNKSGKVRSNVISIRVS